MKRIFFTILALILLTGCQSLYYAGMTKVEWESDGTKIMYISGKDMQGVDAIRSCDSGGTCTVHIIVEDSNGSKAIKANVEALKALIKASEDYATIGKALSGGP